MRLEGTYGTMYKIVPETTKDFTNKMTCFKIPGVSGGEVLPQTILPNTSLYTVSPMPIVLFIQYGVYF